MAGSRCLPVRGRAVAAAVVQGDGAAARVLLLKRGPNKFPAGEWCLVTGWIEEGETAPQAARREVAEEAGLTRGTLFYADYTDIFYNRLSDTIEVVPLFLFKVDGSEPVAINEESSAFRWAGFDEAETLVPYRGHREALRHMHARFIARPPASWLRIPED